MEFTKNNLKRFSKSLNNENRIARSLYGIIPHDDFVKEKSSGIASFFSEPQNRRILNAKNVKDYGFMRSFIEMTIHKHFIHVQQNRSDEHCLVIFIDKDLNGSDSFVVNTYDELLESNLEQDSNVMVVIAHFLPFESASQYEECARANYNISFSNRFSFHGSKFMATIRIRNSSMPTFFNRNAVETYDSEIAEIKGTIEGKFNDLETIIEKNASNYHVIKGFRVYFDNLSRINILKLINIKKDHTIDITSSLSSIGMTKETSNPTEGYYNE